MPTLLPCYSQTKNKSAIVITVVTKAEFANWLSQQPSITQVWLQSQGVQGEKESITTIPNRDGSLAQVLVCLTHHHNFWLVGNLPYSLPYGVYLLQSTAVDLNLLVLAWGLGAYQFTRYKKSTKQPAVLQLPPQLGSDTVVMVETIYHVRDLINTPADDLGPGEFADMIVAFAKRYRASYQVIVGKDLLKQNFPLIYTVGRASDDQPRLIDLSWGKTKHPKVTLIGKGVCFDSGGLDLKNASGMALMKKDMGGAAHVLGLAELVMRLRLPIRLRVLIPIVENAVAGNAYRPGDVIKSRKGITIEIGNTDAEGRLILADALTAAVADKPDIIIDMATLTGAARIALGTELPALFCNHDKLANDLLAAADVSFDPLWRMPLHTPYRELLNSTIADINNAGSDTYGGAITAALFLKEFVPDHIAWAHFDLMAWNLKGRAGRPIGGEAMSLRAIWQYLRQRFQT